MARNKNYAAVGSTDTGSGYPPSETCEVSDELPEIRTASRTSSMKLRNVDALTSRFLAIHSEEVVYFWYKFDMSAHFTLVFSLIPVFNIEH